MLGPLLIYAYPAWAFQLHGPPEGLYVHQAAHICFFLAMLYFAFRVGRSLVLTNMGFRYMGWAGLFFALWNLDAFIGHWVELRLSPEDFIGQAQDFSQRLKVDDLTALFYYLLRLDHLWLLPALFLFYLGLKKVRQSHE
ncbi:MAG: hypothetical protein BZ151_01615 [Desulfobacca sp. 4484_104]|nr:MAG: hypothetical protein BZ151_01615 [Desulfobacca sp. 4484_104]